MCADSGWAGSVGARRIFCSVVLFIRCDDYRNQATATEGLCYVQLRSCSGICKIEVCSGGDLGLFFRTFWIRGAKGPNWSTHRAVSNFTHQKKSSENKDISRYSRLHIANKPGSSGSPVNHPFAGKLATMLFRSMCTLGGVSNTLRRLTSPSIRHKSLAYFSSSASAHSKLTAEQVIIRAPAKYEVPELKEVSACGQ